MPGAVTDLLSVSLQGQVPSEFMNSWVGVQYSDPSESVHSTGEWTAGELRTSTSSYASLCPPELHALELFVAELELRPGLMGLAYRESTST